MKKILKNTYVIVGIIAFLFLFFMGLWLGFSIGETLLAAVVLTIVGVGSMWWKYEVW